MRFFRKGRVAYYLCTYNSLTSSLVKAHIRSRQLHSILLRLNLFLSTRSVFSYTIPLLRIMGPAQINTELILFFISLNKPFSVKKIFGKCNLHKIMGLGLAYKVPKLGLKDYVDVIPVREIIALLLKSAPSHSHHIRLGIKY